MFYYLVTEIEEFRKKSIFLISSQWLHAHIEILFKIYFEVVLFIILSSQFSD